MTQERNMVRKMTKEERAQQTNDIVDHLMHVYQEIISEQRETIERLRRQVARDQKTIDRLEALKDEKQRNPA